MIKSYNGGWKKRKKNTRNKLGRKQEEGRKRVMEGRRKEHNKADGRKKMLNEGKKIRSMIT